MTQLLVPELFPRVKKQQPRNMLNKLSVIGKQAVKEGNH